MGNFIPSNKERIEAERKQQEHVYNEALRKYNARIESYRYHPTMPYWRYERLCRAQFEMELLPDYVKYGITSTGKKNETNFL